ncbi:TetR/AcrR family transcriptional regulator [Longispora sp. NPDC051575]|uniref:TetR/AcrR family transcriptional regulator n=1 Tax=Longispora sp. NPDC051575 TaxID=3154943 RepID=UPI0034186A3E
MTAPLSGRKAQAALNDQRILEAARAVFLADPNAPISAVAEAANVGISALYRRYASKEDLLHTLATDGLDRYLAEAGRCLADEGDAWAAFAEFMERCVDAGTSSLTARLAGSFTPSDALNQAGRRAGELTYAIIARTIAGGGLRPDILVGDLSLIFEQLQTVTVGDADRVRQLRRRYLALYLAALRDPDAPPLPGPAPDWAELSGRYAR